MKKLHILFLLVGGLMILGCQLPVGPSEGQEVALTVTASPSGGGTVARSPSLSQYESGTVVTLTAKPSSAYEFTRWEGDATGSANPTTITMNRAITVEAVFTPTIPQYTLTVCSPTGGYAALSPNLSQYESGTIVTLTANPKPDYEFTRWEGDATGSENPITIEMNGNKFVRVIFSPTKPLIQLPEYTSVLSYSLVKGQEVVPDARKVNITNGGAGILSGLKVSFGPPWGWPAWLSAALSSTTAPATLTITFNNSLIQSLESSTLHACIEISSPVAIYSPVCIDVTVRLCIPRPPEPVYVPPSTKVICAELHRQGLMDERIFEADEAFGRYLRDNQRDVLLGYQLWAKPVVKWMQKSKIATRIVASVATPWSYEMAYRMGARDKGSLAGKILMYVGVPVCRTIGWGMTRAGNMGSHDDADGQVLAEKILLFQFTPN